MTAARGYYKRPYASECSVNKAYVMASTMPLTDTKVPATDPGDCGK